MPPLGDKAIHTIQFFGLLITAIILILFAHDYIPASIVFTSMIAGLSGVVGSRIASNGYAPLASAPKPMPATESAPAGPGGSS